MRKFNISEFEFVNANIVDELPKIDDIMSNTDFKVKVCKIQKLELDCEQSNDDNFNFDLFAVYYKSDDEEEYENDYCDEFCNKFYNVEYYAIRFHDFNA